MPIGISRSVKALAWLWCCFYLQAQDFTLSLTNSPVLGPVVTIHGGPAEITVFQIESSTNLVNWSDLYRATAEQPILVGNRAGYSFYRAYMLGPMFPP